MLVRQAQDNGVAEGLALGEGAVALEHHALTPAERHKFLWLLERMVLYLQPSRGGGRGRGGGGGDGEGGKIGRASCRESV